MASKKHLIIGAGSAALSALREIRRLNSEDEVKLATMDDSLPYSPAALPYLLSGRIAETELWMKDETYFSNLRCTLLKGKEVIQVLPDKKLVVFEDESSENYDSLLIASGSEPIKPSIKGWEKVRPYDFRALPDCRRLLQDLKYKENVVILGAGMIGLKIATALLERGCQVSIIEKEKNILPLYFDEEAESYIKQIFSEHKARFFEGKTVVALDMENGKIVVTLSDGSFLDADILINSMGTKSRTSFLAEKTFRTNKGILVNRKMSTGVDNIYAAGDVVEATDFFTGRPKQSANIPNAIIQGRVAGLNMVGGDAQYEGAISITAFNFFGNQACSIGLSMSHIEAGEVWKRQNDQERNFKKFIFKEDRLVGAMFVNDKIDPGIILYLIRKRVDVKAHKDALLNGTKSLSNPWLSSLKMIPTGA
jgi:phenylglyoxylate dehydrogenase epsilon subunit